MRWQLAAFDRWAPRLGVAILALCFTGASSCYDEDGTGFDPGDTRGGLALMNQALGTSWTDSRQDHPDYVEDFGIDGCVDCHLPDGAGYFDDFAPGCVTCHGPEFCETSGSEGLVICEDDEDNFVAELSPGTILMNDVLGVDWPDPQEDHRDFVEEMGVEQCVGCHALQMGGKPSASTFDGQGCLSCHGPEFCGAPGTETLLICAFEEEFDDDDEFDEDDDDHDDDDDDHDDDD